MRVLVIEDNADLRDYLRVALESQGHEVRTADNGRSALPYLEGHQVDVVVTDIYMPEMDGIETVAMLQQRFPEVRVIAMSGKPASHVPVMEELFWRSFVMRWIHKPDFLKVVPAEVGIKALAISSVFARKASMA